MTLESHRPQERLPSQERRSWIVSAVLIAGGVFLLEVLGLFQTFDDLTHDWATRVLVTRCLIPAEVLLIYADPQPSESESEELETLLDQLEELQAKHIALALPLPSKLAERYRNRASITIGHTVVRNRHNPEVFYAPPESTLDVRNNQDAVVVLPPRRNGTFREQLTRVEVAGNWHPTLESAVTQRLMLNSAAGSSFRIHFRGAAGSLPHVDLASAISGGLIPELVTGRTVLIGRSESSGQLGVATPTTGEHDEMSVLEFHGHALNTLLTGATVHRTSPRINWLIYVLVAIAAGLCFESVTARGCGLLLPALLVLDVACLLLFLWGANVWIPAFEIAAVQVACFERIVQRRNAFAQVAWRQLIETLYSKLRQRQWPTGLFSEEEPWSQIVSFIHQTLNLSRLIILELGENSFHVREVKALNCELADIDEHRRDCRRWPYVAALDEQRPLALDVKKPFLRLAADEEQYLVPLVFSGDVFGFMAIGAVRSEIADSVEFQDRLAEFADQIAELLYRRRHILSQRKRESRWFNRLRQSADARIYGQLVHATHLLEQRMTRLENMFDKSATAAAIYNVFGRLMMVNAMMAQLLKNEGVVAAELSTVDLIAVLTKRDRQAARDIVQQVVTSRRPESIAVTLENQTGDYLFTVRPMESEVSETQVVTANQSPFQLQGILCELVDRSDVVRTHYLRQQLTEGFGNTLRNDFAAVDMAANLIADETAPPEQRRECLDLIHGRVETALRSLRDFEHLMPTDLYSTQEECLPIASVPVLKKAITTVQSQAGDRGIAIKLQRAPLVSHVFAAPNLLPRVFEAILEFLVLDSRDDSELGVNLEETRNKVIVTFANQGFGVAINSVHELLDQESLTNVPESQNLRRVLEQIHAWGGKMTAASEIGSGTSIKLMLRKFQ